MESSARIELDAHRNGFAIRQENHFLTLDIILERPTRIELVHSVWKTDMLTVEHQGRIFIYFCLNLSQILDLRAT